MAPAAAPQVRLICDDETAVAARPVGAAGDDADPRLGGREARGGVGDGQRLRPGRPERDGERLHARIGRGERVLAGRVAAASELVNSTVPV